MHSKRINFVIILSCSFLTHISGAFMLRSLHRRPLLHTLHSSKFRSIMSESRPSGVSEYEYWVRRLYDTNMFHPVKMGLTNIEHLHSALGYPIDTVPTVVHIAGTNGKGSVAHKIAKTLELSGQKVGLFVSPHVSSFRERMQVNGNHITEEQVTQGLPLIYNICQEQDIPATFFEITTALAFWYFVSQQVDAVVLETGLGGRLDATNVIKAPSLSVITSIGLEHTKILGDTVELIALEKGGIIKPGRPVLVGPHVPHEVLRQCAKEKGALHYYTCGDVVGGNDDETDYDKENARIASAAVKLLLRENPNWTISDQVIARGTSQRPSCRFEEMKLDNGVLVILDVAHNPPAMEYLIAKLKATYPGRSYRMVVGMSSDKDLNLCAQSILQECDVSRIHLVEAAHPRAAKVEEILEKAPQLREANYDREDPSITKQVHLALDSAALAPNEIVVICGSVFLMTEAREALGINEPRDSAYIAEMAGAGVRHGQENFGNTKI